MAATVICLRRSCWNENLPQIEITTFLHNAEASFFLGALRINRSMRALAVLCVNYLAEGKAVSYSDNIICLSERDSQSLQSLYDHGETHISPLAMRDSTESSDFKNQSEFAGQNALFIDGGFYANYSGIQWHVQHVVPYIDVTTCIVGLGFEDLQPSLAHRDKVKMLGVVDSVAQWYQNAQFLVAPVFDGSGMETRVAGALILGKRVVGTPEAFSGYRGVTELGGWVCVDANEFIMAISIAQNSTVDSYDPALRTLYENIYSDSAASSRLGDISCTAGE